MREQPQLPGGFYPFWFWNDRVEADELRRQVHAMAEQGIKGFFIHPRQGLAQPYLSESYFQMVDAAVEAAEESGLIIGLYDEYPYPSGVAGGSVVLGEPQYMAVRLVHRSCKVSGGRVRWVLPQGRVLSLKAYPLQSDGRVDWQGEIALEAAVGPVLTEDSYVERGLTEYNNRRYFASEPHPVLETVLPEGNYTLYASLQVLVTDHKYWGYYVDILNPEAVQRFIQLTHERYRQRYAHQFGHTIRALFVDEVQPSWSHRVPAEFQRRCGYALEPLLPAVQDANHPEHVRTAADLERVLHALFLESFEEPVARWCEEAGLLYCGEKPSQTFSQLNKMAVPGCDTGHVKAGRPLQLTQAQLRHNAKAAGSSAYLYDKQGALCECYHSLGWSGNLQDAKLIAEGLLWAGVEILVPHAFFYTTHNLRKHDAPPSFFWQMPFWSFFGCLTRRMTQLHQLFADTYPDAQLVILDPNGMLPDKAGLAAYAMMLEVLSEYHIDFHVVGHELLLQGRQTGGRLPLKDLEIDTVVVPPVRCMPPELEAWLKAFAAAGGTVLDWRAGGDNVQFRQALAETVQPSLSIASGGEEIPQILSVKRRGRNRVFWFILNTSEYAHLASLSNGRPLREVALDEHESFRLESRNSSYERLILPYESFILEETAVGADQPIGPVTPFSAEGSRLPVLSLHVNSACRIRSDRPNLLRLDPWELEWLTPEGDVQQKAVVPAVPLSRQLELGRIQLRPEWRQPFGGVPQMQFPAARLCYTRYFDYKCGRSVELALEPGSIRGGYQIQINQSAPFGPEALRPSSAHIAGTVGVDITSYLTWGTNRVVIHLQADQPNHGLLNPLYLAGDFGVLLDPDTLTEPASGGRFEDYAAHRRPHYAGMVEYTTSFLLRTLPPGDYLYLYMQHEAPFHEAAAVSVNGSAFIPVLWQPRSLRLPREYVRAGENEVRIRVYTSLVRAFQGEYFDHGLHIYCEADR